MAAPLPTVEASNLPDEVPLLPVRDLVVFPFMVVPLFVSRPMSLAAVGEALGGARVLFLAAQREAGVESPEAEQIYEVGCCGKILRQRRLPDGQVKLLVQGLFRAEVARVVRREPFISVALTPRPDEAEPEDAALGAQVEQVKRAVQALHERKQSLPEDVLTAMLGLDDPAALADLVAANLGLKVPDAQAVLEADAQSERLRRVREALDRELEAVSWKKRIQTQAKEEISRVQREYFLREQLKQIRTELGDLDEDPAGIEELRARIEGAEPPPEARAEAEKQLKRLTRMNPDSAEAQVVRNYLEWVVELPWGQRAPQDVDLDLARATLDEAHYGLAPVKDRILEYLGVLKLKADHRGPILCFVGPPGVGKTSLGRGIANALGRAFVRISLGGVRDEAEIRGHRRTYVGAMPGRIVSGLKQAGQMNPVIMLDELDKVVKDSRGDPAAALLEVLDFEQNQSFHDDYLGLPIDLSQVIWVATANLVEPIPPPLRDRMELIQLPGYERHEKAEIARRYIVPRQLKECGLAPEQLRFSRGAVDALIRDYTREAGLRGLERAVAAVARKVALGVAEGRQRGARIGAGDLARYLGPVRHNPEQPDEEDRIGLATGLAWTEAGGTILHVEAARMPGRQALTLTGQLGKVMQESAQTALSCARAHATRYGVPADAVVDQELHVHVPQGAIPKDGPSAGITIATALVSLLSQRPVRRDVAMTGEVTLRGRVLPIGGLREKLLAAVRAGLREVIIPQANAPELKELSRELRRRIQVTPVRELDEALARAIVGFEAP